VPDLAIRQTTTKGGYRGDNINDVGADYREAGVRCQAAVYLFYFIVVISCFCIIFYKDFLQKTVPLPTFFCGIFSFFDYLFKKYVVSYCFLLWFFVFLQLFCACCGFKGKG